MPIIKLEHEGAAPDAYDDIHNWAGAYRSEKALACPFCGYAPMLVRWHGGGPRKRMIMCRCDEYPVCPQISGNTEQQALDKWNTRAQ
jgi:restriction alleviation protein Lar